MKTNRGTIWLAAVFVAAGALHFIIPDFYLPAMPPYLPHPRALILISGFFEIAGGIGVLLTPVRHVARWGLVLLLVAVFPANVQMLLNGLREGGWNAWSILMLLRLPLQWVLIRWVLRATSYPGPGLLQTTG